MQDNTYETIIIGAGIAGITAAIYASRKRMRFLIISKDFGGQINVSGEIENYPGFSHTSGVEFAKTLKNQLDFNGIKIQYESLKKIEKQDDGFVVKTDKAEYKTETVIIASGARARKLNVPGEREFANKGVTYCAICDGPLFKDKAVAIIGGGDSALEAADFLTRIASRIYIINISDEIIGHEYLMEKVIGKEKIEIINNAKTTEILGDKFVKGLKYEQNGEIKQIGCEGIFIEIGRVPNADFARDFLELDDHGHIKISKHCETSINGIYAAGDVADLHEYQYIIAGGQGCTALLTAAKHKRK